MHSLANVFQSMTTRRLPRHDAKHVRHCFIISTVVSSPRRTRHKEQIVVFGSVVKVVGGYYAVERRDWALKRLNSTFMVREDCRQNS